MASRRSRLKAVANLPVRRKPLSVQPEVECSNLAIENVIEPLFESGEKELDIGICEDASNTKKLECSESVETAISSVCAGSPVTEEPVPPVPQEVEKDNIADVPSNENFCKPNQTNKSLPNPAFRFGRRVKPSVSLAVLKDRTQRGETHTELSPKECESPPAGINHFNAQDINNSNVLGNDFCKSVTNEIIGEGDISKTLSQAVAANSSETLENKSTGNISPEKPESEQCHLMKLCDSTQKTTERTLHINLKSPIISTKQSVHVNEVNSSGKTTPDFILKQKNEVLSQSNANLSEHSQNHLASHNSFNFPFGATDSRRAASWMKQKKPKFNDFARKVADARREFQRKYEKIPPDRSSLRMIDLIFYNPSTNPMESKTKFEKKELHMNDQDLINESKEDDPDPVEKNSDLSPDDEVKSDDFDKMPVPQVKIGSNGEIILDEKSLVIETTDAKKGREDLQNSIPVFEDRASKTCYYKRKTQKSRDWSDLETKRFYKALNTIGTDFSLMQKYFPVRTRLELKNKFKREEKLNRNLVDKALNNPSEFDITQFEKYLAMEKKVQEEENDRRLQRKIRPKRPEGKVRSKASLLAKEITESDEEDTGSHNASQEDQARMKLHDMSKKANEINLLCEKYSMKGSDRDQDGMNQQSSNAVVFEVVDQMNGINSSSKVFTNPIITESNNASKIRDAFDEIQNLNHSEINRTDGNSGNNNMTVCGDLISDSGSGIDVVDEFYQAVVSLSASLKNEIVKNPTTANRVVKKVKPLTKGEKRRASVPPGRKQNAKKLKEHPYMSTLDIETYDSKYDSNSSSNESNDNTFTSTKTITDQDFIKLLAANAQNMKESKIQFQITESCSLEKNVEIILDNVPSITLSEI